MNKILLFLTTVILLSSCSKNVVPIFFKNKNEVKPVHTKLSKIKILVSEITDERKYESAIEFKGNKKKIDHNGNEYCLNADGKYRDDFFYYLTKFGSKYIFANSSLRTVSNKTFEYDYELKWSISNYEVFQEFSHEALKSRNTQAFLGSFGLIGAGISAATTDDYFKSFAKVKIVFDSIELYDKEERLVHRFINLERVLEDDLAADAECECAYYNVDLQFKYFILDLVPELEQAILKDLE